MANISGVDPAMAVLQERAIVNELDFQFVMDCLKNYASPRSKLTRRI